MSGGLWVSPARDFLHIDPAKLQTFLSVKGHISFVLLLLAVWFAPGPSVSEQVGALDAQWKTLDRETTHHMSGPETLCSSTWQEWKWVFLPADRWGKVIRVKTRVCQDLKSFDRLSGGHSWTHTLTHTLVCLSCRLTFSLICSDARKTVPQRYRIFSMLLVQVYLF